jgi:acyl dehydratase
MVGEHKAREVELTEDVTQLGQGLYFEDFRMGRKFKTVRRTIQDADVCAFINVTHMNEVLFTDMKHAVDESPIKGRVVPGALTYCFAEGLCIVPLMQYTGIAFLQMDLTIENPAFAGDTIHVELEVIEARLSKSRADRGLVRTRNRVVKDGGVVVLTYTPLRIIRRRDAAHA